MQHLIFQWYLHQLGWYHLLIYIYIGYIGTKEYSYITSLLPHPTPTSTGGGGNHDHGGGEGGVPEPGTYINVLTIYLLF